MNLTQTKRDWLGFLVAILCIGLAVWVYSAASSYSRFAAVFPKTISIILILASLANVVITLIKKGEPRHPSGSLGRPIGLIAVGALWAISIPILGFLISSIFGFIFAMILAKFDKWSKQVWLRFIVIAIVVVSSGYSLFRFLLNVPL